jgi:hypothetical protein
MRRFIGALVLDASAYEEIEGHPRSAMQSLIVIVVVCLAGGMAAMGLGLVGLEGFVTGVVVSLGAWLVWAAAVITLGTITFAQPQTRSDLPELLRVLGFAAAPGVFAALAAMPAAAPTVIAVVVIWMIAAAMIAVRQALDYRSITRAAAVCIAAAMLSFAVMGAVAWLFTEPVS